MGESQNLSKEVLQASINEVEKGALKQKIDRVFKLHEVSVAHQYMEENKAVGKVVVKI